MLRDQLYEFLHRKPFQPFRVHMKEGRTVDVYFPDTNLLGQGFMEIGILEPNSPDRIPERCEFVLLSQVVQVELLPGPAAAVSS